MRTKEIRLTGTSYAVLALLDHLGEATPYDLKRAIETSIENFWPVPHTTFYAEPARLARAGYLAVDQEAGGRRRKRYALTDRGRDALRAWAAEPESSPPQIHDEGVLKMFAGADPLAIMTARAAWHRDKLAELEGYLAGRTLDGGGEMRDSPRAVATLTAGLVYHRQMLGAIEGVLAQGPPP